MYGAIQELNQVTPGILKKYVPIAIHLVLVIKT